MPKASGEKNHSREESFHEKTFLILREIKQFLRSQNAFESFF
jgi:hypothetical protein